MRQEDLGPLFRLVTCECGEEHFANEPCPRCTAGDYDALEARLAAAQARALFLLRLLQGLGEETRESPPA